MAYKPVPPKEHQFKKGNKASTGGKPKELLELDRVVKDEKILFKQFLLNCMRLPQDKLDEVIKNPESSAFNKMCAHLARRACTGDHDSTKFVIERLFGKVKEIDESESTPKPEEKIYVVEMTKEGKFKHQSPKMLENTEEIVIEGVPPDGP